jgi:hypothetical protein
MTTKARTLRTACPSCSGIVPRSEGSRAERCPFCGHRSLLWGESARELRLSLPSSLDAETALDAAKAQMVEQKLLSLPAAQAATFEEPTLYFVPYLWLSTTRTGLLERSINVGSDIARRVDTKVLIDDFEAFRLAVVLPGWGLSGLDIGAMLAREDIPMPLPFDSTALRRLGFVLSPTKGFDDLRSWAAAADSAAPITERQRILFVPIWNIVFTVEGRRSEARIDAVSGVLLSARAPEDERWRVPMALFAVALPSFVLGKVIGASTIALQSQMYISFLNPDTLIIAVPSLLVGGFLFLACLSFAWSLLRYEADLVFEQGHLWSEQLERPEDRGLTGLAGRLAAALVSKVTGARGREEER